MHQFFAVLRIIIVNNQNSDVSMERLELMDLAIDVAEINECNTLLERIAQGLAAYEEIALARVWRIKPGDICDSCPQAESCSSSGPGSVNCLQLVASAVIHKLMQRPIGAVSMAVTVAFLGWRKIGRIAQSGEAMVLRQLDGDGSGFADPSWVAREGIHGFCGQPLIYRGEILGVIGLFTRVEPTDEQVQWVALLPALPRSLWPMPKP